MNMVFGREFIKKLKLYSDLRTSSGKALVLGLRMGTNLILNDLFPFDRDITFTQYAEITDTYPINFLGFLMKRSDFKPESVFLEDKIFYFENGIFYLNECFFNEELSEPDIREISFKEVKE